MFLHALRGGEYLVASWGLARVLCGTSSAPVFGLLFAASSQRGPTGSELISRWIGCGASVLGHSHFLVCILDEVFVGFSPLAILVDLVHRLFQELLLLRRGRGL